VSRFIDDDRNKSILERIVTKDICKRCGDDRPETIRCQRPGSVFAARAAAEVVAGQKDLRTFRFRFIQDKIRFWRAIRVLTPICKEMIANAIFIRGFEEARRNNLICINIIDWQRYDPRS
jgi:hypothetical protein